MFDGHPQESLLDAATTKPLTWRKYDRQRRIRHWQARKRGKHRPFEGLHSVTKAIKLAEKLRMEAQMSSGKRTACILVEEPLYE